ncbi:MAG: UTP--glucose-1-phosphate uridylyltransferase [Clostridia bacterium]|nr:UTP--glucose-1-phosphate uridylyltransferase [Clostridia bacterium]
MNNEYEEVIKILEKFNQTNLINLLNKLEDKTELIKQINNVNFEQMMELFNSVKENKYIDTSKIEHINYVDKSKLSDKDLEEYTKIGEEVIKNGEYAVVTMAGGQGTRLGHNGPKGTFKITVNGEEKYLFQIIVESLQKANNKYNVIIPWYVMTSSENKQQTVEFLEKNNYFGYQKEKVKFFVQGNLPLVDTNGELIINENELIKEASDGNGSIYQSMKKDGIIEDMKNNNIKWIFVGGVDNILLKIVDPVLTGLTIKENNKISSKSVVKTNPKEKVGVFCKIAGKPKVIEYTELPEEMACKRDENGELVFGEVNILSHLYSIEAIEELSNKKLPYHVAFKKANYLDNNGNFIKVTEPNAYKFEAFIFDAFEEYEDMSILRVKREEEFAPIKNAEGPDSPETACMLYTDFIKSQN